jgi:hypothetical protein
MDMADQAPKLCNRCNVNPAAEPLGWCSACLAHPEPYPGDGERQTAGKPTGPFADRRRDTTRARRRPSRRDLEASQRPLSRR